MQQGRQGLTPIDFFKTLAVLFFLIDMTGYTFFSEGFDAQAGDVHLWWRAVGQLYVPIMFFLVGYAKTRDLTPALWAAAFFLLGQTFVSGGYVFPINVIFTIIGLRALIDPVALFAFRRWSNLYFTYFIFAMFFLHSNFLFEYGTLAPCFALVGYALRHRGTGYGVFKDRSVSNFLYLGSVLIFVLTEWTFFNFGKGQLLVLSVGTAILLLRLARLNDHNHMGLVAWFDRSPLGGYARGVGRHTLLIYVISMTFFTLIGWLGGYGFPIFGWFDWEWTVIESFSKARGPISP